MGQINKKRINQRVHSRLIFYILMLIIPVAQVIVFYYIVNANTFILAFQKYAIGKNGYDITFAGFENFENAFAFLKTNAYAIKNSLILAFFTVIVGITLALFFSLYIYKGFPLAKAFRLLLFMPQIISGLVLSLLFKYFSGPSYVAIVKLITGNDVLGLLANPNTQFQTVLIYTVFMGFGINVLMFSNAMSGIDVSLVESAQLDGAGFWNEFIYITFPMIFPTFVSFFILGVTGIATHQMNLFSMFGRDAMDIGTLGYILFCSVTGAQEVSSTGVTYGTLSAVCIIISVTSIILVTTFRKLSARFGPKTE